MKGPHIICSTTIILEMRQMETGDWVRVMKEQVGVMIGDPVVLPVVVIKGQQINQVDNDGEEEPLIFPSLMNFNGERACEDDVIAVKINGTVTEILIDSGAQSSVLGEQLFHDLPEERNLPVYDNGCRPVVGKFEATIEFYGKTVVKTVLLTQGERWCLLGGPAAKKQQVLKVGPELVNMTTIYSIGSGICGIVGRFPKVFFGVGELSGYQLSYTSIVKLHE